MADVQSIIRCSTLEISFSKNTCRLSNSKSLQFIWFLLGLCFLSICEIGRSIYHKFIAGLQQNLRENQHVPKIFSLFYVKYFNFEVNPLSLYLCNQHLKVYMMVDKLLLRLNIFKCQQFHTRPWDFKSMSKAHQIATFRFWQRCFYSVFFFHTIIFLFNLIILTPSIHVQSLITMTALQ